MAVAIIVIILAGINTSWYTNYIYFEKDNPARHNHVLVMIHDSNPLNVKIDNL